MKSKENSPFSILMEAEESFNFDRLILLPCNKMGFGFESREIAISRKLIENFNAVIRLTHWFSVRFENSNL